jgi:uncharacterized membrane protein
MNTFVAYIATLVPLLFLDGLWILVLAKKFYADHLGFLFTKSVNIAPVLVFYPLYAVGVLLLVVLPAVSSSSWVEALWRGALLGLVAYGTYDLTNHATISNWPLSVTLVDIIWGMTVTSVTSVIAYFIITAFK